MFADVRRISALPGLFPLWTRERRLNGFRSAVQTTRLLDGWNVCLRASNLVWPMTAPGREREFANRHSGHSGADRPGVLAARFPSVGSASQTGR